MHQLSFRAENSMILCVVSNTSFLSRQNNKPYIANRLNVKILRLGKLQLKWLCVRLSRMVIRKQTSIRELQKTCRYDKMRIL